MIAARFTLPVTTLLLAVAAGPARGIVGARTPRTVIYELQDSDAYVLSVGKSFWSTNTSLEKMQGLRKQFAGEFLWVRRGSKAFLVRDPGALRQVRTLFDPLRTLEPDRAALERLRFPLETREEALDREQEALDREADRLSDRKKDKSAGAREGSGAPAAGARGADASLGEGPGAFRGARERPGGKTGGARELRRR
jgi:hypothetical protein